MIDRPKLKSALPPASFALIVAAVVVLGWHDLRRFTAGRALTSPGASAFRPEAPAAMPPSSNLREGLLSVPYFGAPDATPGVEPPPPPPPVEEAELPESTAGYQLFGLIEADTVSQARAFIGTSDGTQREYRVGEAMPDGARVHAVRERAVIFDRNGQFERLAMPTADDGGAGPVTRKRPLPTARAPMRMNPSMYADPYGGPPTEMPMPPTEVPMAPTEVPMPSDMPMDGAP